MGKIHPDTVTSLNNIGRVFENMGRYEESLKYHHQCLMIRENIMGKNHSDYAASLSNIGNSLKSIGNYEEALKYY